MDETVKSLYKKGLISLIDIADYLKRRSKDDEFIKSLLNETGTMRSPNEWDRKNLKTWREWGFSDEMIYEAAKISGGRTNPMIYMNTVLSNWKNKSIFTIEDIPNTDSKQTKNDTYFKFENERTYTKEELDSLISNIDDVDFS